MVQIEAVMNSRQLTPLSSNPDDIAALTPGYFLIGDPLTAANEQIVDDIPINRLDRWRHIYWIHQQFWNRWSKEYIHQLQGRTKWTKVSTNLTPNTLVLLQDENLPPLQWLLGRVISVQPGNGGLLRTATIHTAKGIFSRAITRLAVIPDNPDKLNRCAFKAGWMFGRLWNTLQYQYNTYIYLYI